MIRVEHYQAMEGNAGLNRKKEDPNELARQNEDQLDEARLHPVYSSGSARSSAAVSPQATPRSKKKGGGDRKPKRKNMPRRPLTAYNLFFKSERKRLVASIHGEATDLLVAHKERRHRKVNGIGFANMAKIIAKNWKALTPSQRAVYDDEARRDRARYEREMQQLDRQGGETEDDGLSGQSTAAVARLPQLNQPASPPPAIAAATTPPPPYTEANDPDLLEPLSREPGPSAFSRDIFREDFRQDGPPDPVTSDVPPASPPASPMDTGMVAAARLPSPTQVLSSASDQQPRYSAALHPTLLSSGTFGTGDDALVAEASEMSLWYNASETDAAFDHEIMQIAPVSGFSVASNPTDLFKDDDSFSS